MGFFKGTPSWQKKKELEKETSKEKYIEQKNALHYRGTVSGQSVTSRIVAALTFKRKKESGEIISPSVLSEEGDQTVSAKPASAKCVKLTDLEITLPSVQEKYEVLSNQGSRQYTVPEKILIARSVMILLLEWLSVLDSLAQAPSMSDLSFDDQLTLRGVVGNNSQVGNPLKATFSKACLICAQRLGVRVENVKSWAGQLYHLGYLVDDKSSRRTALIFEDKALPAEYVLEIIEYIRSQAKLGYRSNYRTAQAHINSDVRLHDMVNLETCPRAIVSIAAIRRALARSGCIQFAPIKCVGRSHHHSQEQTTTRLWRLEVFFAQMAQAMQREERGEALLVQMDESFINLYHFSDFSLTEVDDNGKPIGEIHCNKGKGPRLCLVGAICQFGPLVTKTQDGSFVRDHAWINARGEPVSKHGHFVELDAQGRVRHGFEQGRRGAAAGTGSTLPRVDTMKKQELIDFCTENSISLPSGKLTCPVLKDLVRPVLSVQRTAAACAAAAEKAARTGKAASADQAVSIDFAQRAKDLEDLALTTFKVFPANCSNGDYHDNFDTETFFKWFFALLKTYPVYCKQLQERLDAGEMTCSHPFFDNTTARPTRTLILSLDNAPYHKGIAVQLSSKNKMQIAEILRSKQVSSIVFSHHGPNGEVVQATAEVPPADGQWQTGFPNVDQLREGALRALKQVARQLVELPFMEEIRKLHGQWGPPGAPAVELVWNAPNVSPQIAVEYLWADGKNEVAKPHNQTEDRSLADISDILHNRWFEKIDSKCRKLFDHASKVMTEAISQAHMAGGPLHGKLPHLQGFPTTEEVLMQWKRRASMKDDEGDDEEEDDSASDVGEDDSDDIISTEAI